MFPSGRCAYTEEEIEMTGKGNECTVITGCGRLGESIAGKLSEEKKDVKVLDCDKTAFRKLVIKFLLLDC